jgi:hypothetical protein
MYRVSVGQTYRLRIRQKSLMYFLPEMWKRIQSIPPPLTSASWKGGAAPDRKRNDTTVVLTDKRMEAEVATHSL